jgi:hypothetical protein
VTRHASPLSPAAAAALEARFALRVCTHLNQHSEQLPHELGERLKVARAQAIERARSMRLARQPAGALHAGSGILTLSGWGGPWWSRLASVLPLVALVAGLVLIQELNDDAKIEVAADVDAALLADTLPPAAYGDAGFVEYLKTPRN